MLIPSFRKWELLIAVLAEHWILFEVRRLQIATIKLCRRAHCSVKPALLCVSMLWYLLVHAYSHYYHTAMFSYARFSFISVQYGSRSLKLPWNRWSITVNIGCVCFMPLHGKAAQPWCSLWWIAWFKQVASLCKLMCAPLYSETCRTQGLPGNKQKGSDLLSFAETLLKLFSFYPSGWWSIAVNPPGRQAAWTPKFVNMITRGGDIGFWNIIP